jgi:16S rRNA (uracil1498-N3)-methyltransferase
LFVADLSSPVLADADVHHLVRVLRAGVGDPVTLSDGEGRWRPARFVDREGEIESTGDVREVPAPTWPLTVAFAPVKGDRPEWTVQKLTEIGVDRIVPVMADRSVVRWAGERGAKQVDRLRRVSREAAMQSRRCRLPEIDGPRPARPMLSETAAAAAEPGAPAPTGDERVLVVGPEGGWSGGELAVASSRVGLGPNVLRAETAAVVGAALLVAIRVGLTLPTTNSG